MKYRIGISLGGIGTFQDGLGEFAFQIGSIVRQVAPQWRERDGVGFDFHLRESLFGAFGNDVGYLPVTRWQRTRHVQPVHYDLWHSLHQLNKTLPPRGRGECIVTVHDLNYIYHPKAFSRWRHGRRTRRLIAHTDRVVAISRYVAEDVKKHLHWQGPLEVILRGARPFAAGPQEPLPGWQADDARPFLFHLSRMSPSKNPEAIIGLARAWPEMSFVMAGPQGHDTRALRDGTSLPNVQFHLSISDAQKAWALSRCQGFLFPSFAEGFGLPPIEAMQCGAEVFLSRLTSLPEVGGSVAHYFDSFEPAAMRRVVEAGIAGHARPGRVAEIQAHAARFDADTAAREYLALYRRQLGLAPE